MSAGVRVYENVVLHGFSEDSSNLKCTKNATNNVVTVTVDKGQQAIILQNGCVELSRIPLPALVHFSLSDRAIALRPSKAERGPSAVALLLPTPEDATDLRNVLDNSRSIIAPETGDNGSVFDSRTEQASASQYFQFYGYLSQQQNMMQDYIRTATYQRAILSNVADFKDKVVLDVGAGSGILSFFALQSGAKRVYAVEASDMALHCEQLVRANGYSDRIKVVAGKIEDISIPEKVDTLISEPMGYMLLNERMLETYLHAKKFLKPGGKMFPSRGDLHFAPFTDEALYLEQASKANFWCQDNFHGVNLSPLRPQAVQEYFKQPVVDTWHMGILMAESKSWSVDFSTADETDLQTVDIPFEFVAFTSGYIHGLAFWFDVAFIGSNQTIWLSTAPSEPLTHWYQVRCLVEKPLLVNVGQPITGRVLMKANKKQSYDVDIDIMVDNRRSSNNLDLKNPYFRYTGQIVQPPPGNQTVSPTDSYWQSVSNSATPQQAAATASTGLMNGNQSAGQAFVDLCTVATQQHSSVSPGGRTVSNGVSSSHPVSSPSVSNSNYTLPSPTVSSHTMKIYNQQQQTASHTSLPYSSPGQPIVGVDGSSSVWNVPPTSSSNYSG